MSNLVPFYLFISHKMEYYSLHKGDRKNISVNFLLLGKFLLGNRFHVTLGILRLEILFK